MKYRDIEINKNDPLSKSPYWSSKKKVKGWINVGLFQVGEKGVAMCRSSSDLMQFSRFLCSYTLVHLLMTYIRI